MMSSHLENTSSMTFNCREAAMSVTIPLSVLICLDTSRNGSGIIGRSSATAFV